MDSTFSALRAAKQARDQAGLQAWASDPYGARLTGWAAVAGMRLPYGVWGPPASPGDAPASDVLGVRWKGVAAANPQSQELDVNFAQAIGRFVREVAGLKGELLAAARGPLGRRKVAVVDDADHFSIASANCLLKTLEEPPPRSRETISMSG
jgi:hypothetical protein